MPSNWYPKVLPGTVAGWVALVAAFLNGVFGFCLGCEMYLPCGASARRQALAADR